MPLIVVVNGPNLNRLGSREPQIYGRATLDDINRDLKEKASELGVDLEFFQSNHEGAIVDYLQEREEDMQGLIINPGALTHYGYSLREAMAAMNTPTIEVHISNIHAREEWRSPSLLSPVVEGVIVGLGTNVYELALLALATIFSRP
jgi:3-dehydroquinate dehydratase-2